MYFKYRTFTFERARAAHVTVCIARQTQRHLQAQAASLALSGTYSCLYSYLMAVSGSDLGLETAHCGTEVGGFP
jgi:hypothetical protein